MLLPLQAQQLAQGLASGAATWWLCSPTAWQVLPMTLRTLLTPSTHRFICATKEFAISSQHCCSGGSSCAWQGQCLPGDGQCASWLLAWLQQDSVGSIIGRGSSHLQRCSRCRLLLLRGCWRCLLVVHGIWGLAVLAALPGNAGCGRWRARLRLAVGSAGVACSGWRSLRDVEVPALSTAGLPAAGLPAAGACPCTRLAACNSSLLTLACQCLEPASSAGPNAPPCMLCEHFGYQQHGLQSAAPASDNANAAAMRVESTWQCMPACPCPSWPLALYAQSLGHIILSTLPQLRRWPPLPRNSDDTSCGPVVSMARVSVPTRCCQLLQCGFRHAGLAYLSPVF